MPAPDLYYADSDKLNDLAGTSHRELQLADELEKLLTKAAGIAPPELYHKTKKLAGDAGTIKDYFAALGGALTDTAALVEEYASVSRRLLDEAEDEISMLARKTK